MAGLPPPPLPAWGPGTTEEHRRRLTQILATVEPLNSKRRLVCITLWYTMGVWQYQSEHSGGSSKQHHDLSATNLLYTDI